jgi:hypothetical protein
MVDNSGNGPTRAPSTQVANNPYGAFEKPSKAVENFLLEVNRYQNVAPISGKGHLIFALDATASREQTWDMACQLQAEMFREAASTGTLNIKLAYYRGIAECRVSRSVSRSDELLRLMQCIRCEGGQTQIGRILDLAVKEATHPPGIGALVFVGDAMEENPDELIHKADELGRLGVPAFMFQEGNTPNVEQVFRVIAKRAKGAYCRFDTGAAKQLGELLRAVAAFVTGGLAALSARKDAKSIKLLTQMK